MIRRATQLRIDGLTALQLAELRTAVTATADDCITTVGGPTLKGGKVGEPTVVTAIITLAPAVISAVALWLAKSKAKRTRKLRYTKIDSKGSTESFELEETSYEEGESASAALEAFLNRRLGDDGPATS